jgi:SAM-dependent methyltransferase
VTSLVRRNLRVRRAVGSVPVIGGLLRLAASSYHRRRAEVVGAYIDLKDRRLPALRDTTAVAMGSSLSLGGRNLLLIPYRNERVDLPPPLVAGQHRFDVVEDLVEFTSLPSERVHELIGRRIENFRSEWLQLPASLREDSWFYLSSRTYLFANAVHFHDAPAVIEEIADLLPPTARVLDFGGGTGNLALALGARGFHVDYRELSAVQKDFARFRVQRHGLHEQIEILDSWADLPAGRYDAVCAFDVFEHLPDLAQVVRHLAASVAGSGVLIDTPSFSVGLANPMHHEDPGLESLLADQGLVLDQTMPAFRVWAKRPR